MTLISHLWNQTYHVIASDGRISGTINGEVIPICEVYPKIIRYNNGFIAFSSNHFGFEDNEPLRDHIIRINQGQDIVDAKELAETISNSIKTKDKEINAVIYVIKYDGVNNHAFIVRTLKGIEAIPQYKYSFNGDFQDSVLISYIEFIYQKIFNSPSSEITFNEPLERDKIRLLIQNFYDNVERDQSLKMMNNRVKIGLLTRNGFEWI